MKDSVDYQRYVDDLAAKLALADLQIANLQAQLDGAKTSFELAKVKNNDVEVMLTRANAKLAVTEKQLSDARTLNQALAGQIATMEANLSRANREIAGLRFAESVK